MRNADSSALILLNQKLWGVLAIRLGLGLEALNETMYGNNIAVCLA